MPYVPLKQKITQIRCRTEHLFGNQEKDRSLAASRHLDTLIYHVVLIRRGNFRFDRKRFTARRKARYGRIRSQVSGERICVFPCAFDKPGLA